MHRIVYTVLFALCIGYCTFFGSIVKSAFAAPHVIDRQASVYASGELAHNHIEHAKYLEGTQKVFAKSAYPSTKRVGKGSQLDIVRSAYSAQHHVQRSFSISWSPLKLLDLSAWWQQQRNKAQKKDLYDAGE